MKVAEWRPGGEFLPTPSRPELADLPELLAPKAGQRVFRVASDLVCTDSDFADILLWHYTRAVQCIRDCVARVDIIMDVSLLNAYPTNWKVSASWKPFFTPDLRHMAAFAVEQVWRECLRDRGIQLAIHRLGPNADNHSHYTLNDLIFPKHSFLMVTDTNRHLNNSNQNQYEYLPTRQQAVWPNTTSPVAVLGAGGPIPTSAIALLKQNHALTLCDREPLRDIAARGAPHQPKGAPLPELPLLAPHREETFDILDRQALRNAFTGCATIINCACTRYTQNDFRVNTVGAYAAAVEAIAAGVKRIVTTGPQVITLEPYTGFHHDHDVPIDTPARPGCNPYGLSKHIGQELVRVLCEHSDTQGITLLFNGLATPESIHPIDYMTSFADAGRAIQAAVEAPARDITYAALHIPAPMPHGHFRLDRIKEVLGWMPSDSLPSIWRNDD